MKKALIIAGITLIPLSACPHRDTGDIIVPGPTQTGQTDVECDVITDIAQACYDVSDPEISCEEVAVAVLEQGYEDDLPRSQAEVLAGFCMGMCDLRHEGYWWSDVRRAVRQEWCQ